MNDEPDWREADDTEQQWWGSYDNAGNPQEKRMDINAAFPSKYLKATDLQGHTVTVTITAFEMADVGDDAGDKPVLMFHGKDKGLVLNKINSQMIAEMYGTETDAWIGKPITIRPDKTSYNGRLVDCLRITHTPASPAPAPPPVAQPETGTADFDDLPF